jgi:hypothetical protein
MPFLEMLIPNKRPLGRRTGKLCPVGMHETVIFSQKQPKRACLAANPEKPPAKHENPFGKGHENPVENTTDKQLFWWYLGQCLVQPLPQCKAYASNALLRAKCCV